MPPRARKIRTPSTADPLVSPPPLPDRLRPELDAFMEDVASGLGGYGRHRRATDYVAVLLNRPFRARLSGAQGGSRSPRAERARKFLTRSKWGYVDLTVG